MEGTSLIMNLLKIAPMVILLIAAAFVVFRGLRRDGDATNNRAKGSGPHWPGNWY